ncbi:unnamed protein product [Prunus armeniaca]
MDLKARHRIRVGDRVHRLRHKGSGVEKIEEGKVVKLMKKKGTQMALIDSAGAGDIVSMAGLASPSIGHTVANVEFSEDCGYYGNGWECILAQYKMENRLKLEPIEEVTIEVNEEHVGLVMEASSHRRAEIVDMGPVPRSVDRTRLSLTCPSRGLVGYRSVFSSDTCGTGLMHRTFLMYDTYASDEHKMNLNFAELILIYSRWEEKNEHKNLKRKP